MVRRKVVLEVFRYLRIVSFYFKVISLIIVIVFKFGRKRGFLEKSYKTKLVEFRCIWGEFVWVISLGCFLVEVGVFWFRFRGVVL